MRQNHEVWLFLDDIVSLKILKRYVTYFLLQTELDHQITLADEYSTFTAGISQKLPTEIVFD